MNASLKLKIQEVALSKTEKKDLASIFNFYKIIGKFLAIHSISHLQWFNIMYRKIVIK